MITFSDSEPSLSRRQLSNLPPKGHFVMGVGGGRSGVGGAPGGGRVPPKQRKFIRSRSAFMRPVR